VTTTISNFQRTANWLATCGKKPNGLTMSVQAGVMLEEVCELLDSMTLGSPSGIASNLVSEASRVLKEVGLQMKSGDCHVYFHDRKAAVDAFADIKVTVDGTAYLGGFLMDVADKKVLDANDDKFEEDGRPVILPGGKIGKRQGWVGPDHTDSVGELPPVDEESTPFHQTTDAAKWARAIKRMHPGLDEGEMLAWFANAIMSGRDEGRQAVSPASDTAAENAVEAGQRVLQTA
jgi:hypothetical protein